MASIPFSVLDHSPIVAGGTAADALRNSRDLAQQVERLGYHRFWMAEHHSMPGVASSATAVAIAHVAGGTQRIRVGSGGIMLPNHAPLVIAEQFGTLESLFPGRVDLGLGRAPGTDQRTARALRRGHMDTADTFPEDVRELQGYFAASPTTFGVQAVPGSGLDLPFWLLGSSLFSAQLAAEFGLPYAFAAHFAPDYLEQAIQLYRDGFQPSRALAKPYVMVATSVFAAETHREASRLFTSVQQQFLALQRGIPGPLPPPVDDMDAVWAPAEAAAVRRALREAAVGDRAGVKQQLEAFLARTRPDELMITAQIFDHAARVRSYEIVAQLRPELSWNGLRAAG